MAGKYLQHESGRLKEAAAPTTSAGAGDADKIPALDANGKLDSSFMPSGVGADTVAAEASESLSAGDFVNLWDDGGTFKARKADATTVGKEADGFVLAAVTSGNTATVYVEGLNDQLSGLTAGDRLYLDTTAGGSTDTPLSGSGNISQYLGKAVSATAMTFEATEGIELA